MALEQQTTAAGAAEHSFLNSSFPVFLPKLPELQLSGSEFDAHVRNNLGRKTSTPSDIIDLGLKMASISASDGKPEAPFMDALLEDPAVVPSLDDQDGKMLTENGDVGFSKSGNVLVDLFSELETVISADRLKTLLEAGWEEDSEATLRLIWNARSIHLGKSDKVTFYRAAGWLAQNHPQTFLVNLEWLVRPVVQKKTAKDKTDKKDEVVVNDDDFELIDVDIEAENVESPKKKRKVSLDAEPEPVLPEFEVKYGVSHGYWKDLLNILSLAAREKLTFDVTPHDIHCILQDDAGEKKKKSSRDWTLNRKKSLVQQRHEAVLARLEDDPFYRTLHVSIARIFADQLKLDSSRINGSKVEKKLVSMCGKWAPSSKKSHDSHTFIASSIAELLYTFDDVCPASVDPTDRLTYLKYARRAYQVSTLSKLRKHLNVVERPISEDRFNDILYERVPSKAMNQYTSLFIKKDQDHFEQYIEKVANGKARISGATLLPSTLVHSVRKTDTSNLQGRKGGAFVSKLVSRQKEIEQAITKKAIDGQWKTLCQRIKDSGKLESSIAVCDVSGSMQGPVFKDGTCPMDSAIGLSLILAEVTKAPFGGALITFSTNPSVVRVGGPDDKRSFEEKIRHIERSNWSMSTDIVAVFEKLLLPMALENKLKPEDMVKQVFIFSDMQFNQAEREYTFQGASHGARWSTSFERVKKKFDDAGYELPRLIFWNLAGGRGDGVAPKPITAGENNTALVSGYSQSQLKMFLEAGSFEDDPEEVVDKDEDGAVVVNKRKKSMDPVAAMSKAISHEAYRMLKVVD